MSDRTLLYPFERWRVKPQCFRILPRLDQFRNWRPTPQWFCNKCCVLANLGVKNVSVTLWFCFQCSCKKCLLPCDSSSFNVVYYVLFCLFSSTCVLRVCVFVLWASWLVINK